MTLKVEKIVLVVDDEAGIRQVVSTHLKKWGYIPLQASSAEMAISLINDNPDLALMVTDFAMPEMDGKQLIEKVREHHTASKLPIIMMSGVVSLNDIKSVLDVGADRFIRKPLDPKELEEYVKGLLEKR